LSLKTSPVTLSTALISVFRKQLLSLSLPVTKKLFPLPARVLPGFLQRKRSWREIPEREHSYKGPNVGTLGHILVAEEFQRWKGLCLGKVTTLIAYLLVWKVKAMSS
jgi:hypothetical protein